VKVILSSFGSHLWSYRVSLRACNGQSKSSHKASSNNVRDRCLLAVPGHVHISATGKCLTSQRRSVTRTIRQIPLQMWSCILIETWQRPSQENFLKNVEQRHLEVPDSTPDP